MASQVEFGKGLADLGIRASRSELTEIFNEIDADGTGSIDQRELQIAVHRAQRERAAVSSKSVVVGNISSRAKR